MRPYAGVNSSAHLWFEPRVDQTRGVVTVPLDQADFGFVLNQDLSMIRTMQTGLHQPGFTHLTLSSEECRIVNMNRHLEHYLGLEPGGAGPA